MSESQKIRVAILGGGLAGVILLRGLLLHPHVDANIYESRPEFNREGAGIGLQKNAVGSLRAISPSLVDALSSAGAVTTHSAKILIGTGPDAGVELDRYGDLSDTSKILFQNVGRYAFLKELLAPIPENCMHTSKKLERLEGNTTEQTTTLFFSDGSSTTVDVVIGADGVHSLVRQYVLGKDHAALKPRFAGWWHTACLVPFAKAEEVLGKDLLDPEKPCQRIWIGEQGQAILYDFVHGTKLVQCIIAMRGDKLADSKDTSKEISREQILTEFSKWPERFSKGYVNLVFDNAGDPARFWPQLEHMAAQSYVTNDIALLGDAAHCTTPWQGSGGAMAIEDALVLSRLLGRAKSKAQVASALRAYDKVRRPRTQRTIESSFGTGMLLSGLDAEAGLDRAKLEKAIRPRWDFLRDFNPEEHVAEAVNIMDSTQ